MHIAFTSDLGRTLHSQPPVANHGKRSRSRGRGPFTHWWTLVVDGRWCSRVLLWARSLWSFNFSRKFEYFGVDFLRPMTVYNITTQGASDQDQWVTSYRIVSQLDLDSNPEMFAGSDGLPMVWYASYNCCCLVRENLFIGFRGQFRPKHKSYQSTDASSTGANHSSVSHRFQWLKIHATRDERLSIWYNTVPKITLPNILYMQKRTGFVSKRSWCRDKLGSRTTN